MLIILDLVMSDVNIFINNKFVNMQNAFEFTATALLLLARIVLNNLIVPNLKIALI